MRTFAGIEEIYSYYDAASVLLQSIPYDGTSTWGKGADKAFEAFLEAAENMELYDIETDSEAYKQGIHILPELTEARSPVAVFEIVYSTTRRLLESDKYLTFFGGEHSISIGVIKAFYEKYPDLTVLQLDAHADLRPSYEGTDYNHACAVHDASNHANLIQVGIRSMDSIMPSTGTPEPGGMDWNTVINYLRKVFETKNIVGFDIVELAPIEGLKAPDFLVAKLYYKMLSYKFKYNGK